eukprot:scaffold10490_cov66-Phaeocystis_antarctica.AAC.7
MGITRGLLHHGEAHGEAANALAVEDEARRVPRAHDRVVARVLAREAARVVGGRGGERPVGVGGEPVVPVREGVGLPLLGVAARVEPHELVARDRVGPAAREDQAAFEREQPGAHAARTGDAAAAAARERAQRVPAARAVVRELGDVPGRSSRELRDVRRVVAALPLDTHDRQQRAVGQQRERGLARPLGRVRHLLRRGHHRGVAPREAAVDRAEGDAREPRGAVRQNGLGNEDEAAVGEAERVSRPTEHPQVGQAVYGGTGAQLACEAAIGAEEVARRGEAEQAGEVVLRTLRDVERTEVVEAVERRGIDT